MWRITQVNEFLLDAIKRGKAGRFWQSAGSSFFSAGNIDSLKNPLTLTMGAHGSSAVRSAVPRHEVTRAAGDRASVAEVVRLLRSTASCGIANGENFGQEPGNEASGDRIKIDRANGT